MNKETRSFCCLDEDLIDPDGNNCDGLSSLSIGQWNRCRCVFIILTLIKEILQSRIPWAFRPWTSKEKL